ncbi:hypothetical protein BLNAU_18446 [Blattamonas nauphoetae]|uniref:B30.2/SPRY domain-containing protein n=1 Tax=Blattamonas nauphoetae TaxID=2049346 RepID=A0ABQ9X4A8_9EUKA|nr:hypothetical protein BLNAU_18446 [Blattamonas nauphoetae]
MGSTSSSQQNRFLLSQLSHLPASHAPSPLTTLHLLTFSENAHFSITRTTITRTDVDLDIKGPFTSGIVTITITFLSLPYFPFTFGLMDSTSPLNNWGKALGWNVNNSVGLSTDGNLNFNASSSFSYKRCHPRQDEGDCVRMEIDLNSTPRTVQFFVNGEAGRFYVSGIPSSVRIGFSIFEKQTSFRIDNISRLSRPTPILEGMEEVKFSHQLSRSTAVLSPLSNGSIVIPGFEQPSHQFRSPPTSSTGKRCRKQSKQS